MTHGTRVLALILLGLFALSCSGEDREPASEASPSEGAPSPVVEDHPEGFLAKNLESPYWNAYRAVVFKTVCDSLGNVKKADVLYNFASTADTDSLRETLFGLELDKEIWPGQIRRWDFREPPADPDLHFLIPFATPSDGTVAEEIPSREELEQAGLGPWLDIWDEVLPDWPVETWKVVWPSAMREFPDAEVNDSLLVTLDMLSDSPDGSWRLHPFLGAESMADGSVGFDVDGGFILYRKDRPGFRNIVTGTPNGYSAAEWIDDERFVVAGTGEAGLSYPKQGRDGTMYVAYRTPILYLGNVNRLEGFWHCGLPIPIWHQTEVDQELADVTKARYPKLWKALHSG